MHAYKKAMHRLGYITEALWPGAFTEKAIVADTVFAVDVTDDDDDNEMVTAG